MKRIFKKGNRKMEITTELVKHLANLSRLNFTKEELEAFKVEFQKTMEQVDTIEKVDTSLVQEHLDALDAKQNLREDEVKRSLKQEEVLIEAPEKSHGMFRIKKIVE
jgi:aspartyl-tRNA(Asn)/glutamyl-tRNA(Gln) amidotransferase subunit C